ncbi:MAG: histidinol-phosphatase HisJ family protein [Candidatus Krumholzibacteriota bacterium]|nr:histidinol-phosphatase HisJ family protein [Candidatus Krumholzibacteriota bacterium]
MIDYHLHGDFCGHAEGELEEYIQEALRKDFREIGFSAHLPLVTEPDPYHAMVEEKLPDYVQLVQMLRDKYRGRIIVKLGIEADFFEDYQSATKRLLDQYPFDFVLGSVHYLGTWHFTSLAGRDRFKTEDPRSVFPRYFEVVKKAVESGLFDILAHPDAIRKSDFFPDFPLLDEYRAVARRLKEQGMALEVNSAGLRRGAGSVYPEFDFLRACVEENVPVTIGSDAHKPEDVGRDFSLVFDLLRRAGVTELALYENRRMRLSPLENYFPGRSWRVSG